MKRMACHFAIRPGLQGWPELALAPAPLLMKGGWFNYSILWLLWVWNVYTVDGICRQPEHFKSPDLGRYSRETTSGINFISCCSTRGCCISIGVYLNSITHAPPWKFSLWSKNLYGRQSKPNKTCLVEALIQLFLSVKICISLSLLSIQIGLTLLRSRAARKKKLIASPLAVNPHQLHSLEAPISLPVCTWRVIHRLLLLERFAVLPYHAQQEKHQN